MPWGKNFLKVSIRRELPKSFCVFNSENTDSKTNRCEYRWYRHFGLEKQLFSSLKMDTNPKESRNHRGLFRFAGPFWPGHSGYTLVRAPRVTSAAPKKMKMGTVNCVLKTEGRSREQLGICLQREAASYWLRYIGSQEPNQSLIRNWTLPWIAVCIDFSHFNKSHMSTTPGKI